MLDVSGINFLAVALTWLVYVAVGAFWYSPAGFAKQWTALTKIDILKIPKDEANRAIAAVAASALVQVFSLAIILNSLNVTKLSNGLLTGLLLWLGFTTATTVGVTLYSRRSWSFIVLNSSYFFLVMSIGSLILTALR
jgi:hypothetical protein